MYNLVLDFVSVSNDQLSNLVKLGWLHILFIVFQFVFITIVNSDDKKKMVKKKKKNGLYKKGHS